MIPEAVLAVQRFLRSDAQAAADDATTLPNRRNAYERTLLPPAARISSVAIKRFFACTAIDGHHVVARNVYS